MNRPVVVITIAYALGIVAAKAIAIPLVLTLILVLFSLLLIGFSLLHKLHLNYLLTLVCFFLGMAAWQVAELPDQNDVGQYAGKGYLTMTGQVDDQPKLKEAKAGFPLKVKEVTFGRRSRPANGSVYVTVPSLEGIPEYGQLITVRGALNKSDDFQNPLLLSGQDRYFLNSQGYQLLAEGGNPLKKITLWFSRHFNRVLNQILPNKEASLLGSVLLGSSVSPLSNEMKDDYRKAGLIHLLVVSGTQVSILIGICLALTRGIGLPLGLAVAATSFFNLLLVVVTGAGASILRAALMGEITLLGLLFEREKEIYTTLALSALVLLVMDPANLFNIGFQLSFAATWSLVYLVPVLETRIPRALALAAGPMLATAPLITFYFSQVSLGGIISNLLVLPWVEFLVVLGFSTTLLGFIFLPLAQILGGTIWLMLQLLEKIALLVASLPGACFYIPAPPVISVIAYYALLISLIEQPKRRPLILVLFLVLFLRGFNNYFSPSELTLTFLDVGQGDSILIETPGGRNVLIDGGGATGRGGNDPIGERVVVPFLQRKGINKLDLVVLTHPHDDHVGGLNTVLKKIKVDQVLDPGQVYDSASYRNFLSLVKANKIKYSLGRAGQRLDLGAGVWGEVLAPQNEFIGDPNADSIVIRLVYGATSFMLTGDLDEAGEELLGGRLASTLLKVGHHGSRTSTSDRFLSAVRPELAIISCGRKNKFGHPHKITLEKLQGIRTLRTDQVGAITASSDGRRLKVWTTAPGSRGLWAGQRR